MCTIIVKPACEHIKHHHKNTGTFSIVNFCDLRQGKLSKHFLLTLDIRMSHHRGQNFQVLYWHSSDITGKAVSWKALQWTAVPLETCRLKAYELAYATALKLQVFLFLQHQLLRENSIFSPPTPTFPITFDPETSDTTGRVKLSNRKARGGKKQDKKALEMSELFQRVVSCIHFCCVHMNCTEIRDVVLKLCDLPQ